MTDKQSVWETFIQEIEEEQKDYQYFHRYDKENLQKEIYAIQNKGIANCDKV